MDALQPHIDFDEKVNELFTTQRDKESVFEALKRYQSSSDIKKLISELKRIVNEPTKLEIYDYIRPLIRPQHQQGYDKMAPATPGQRLRVIRLRRKMNESFGFAVRGGYEHGIGVFVSHVHPGSQAEHKGLKLGDEIVRVNGFTIAEAIHEEVLNLIKGREEIELKVTNIGMVPIKQSPADPVTWQYVEKAGVAKQQASGSDGSGGSQETRKIFINLRGAPSLGCSIISGPRQFPGIYVESVRAGSLGEDYGLEVGDQIMEVNGKSFINIKHKEAIVELKGSKELNMVIKKAAGVALLNLKNKSPKGSPDTARKHPVASHSPRPSSENSEEVICDILDTELSERQRHDAQQDRERERQMEEERKRQREEAWKKEREQEEWRKHELELQQQMEMERQRERDRLEAERQEAEVARRKLQQEQDRKQEEKQRGEARKQKEEERRKEAERKRLAEMEEERRKTEALAQKRESAVLAGRLGPTRAMKPTLLGAAKGPESSSGSSSDKVIKEVKIRKEEDTPLDVAVEGGVGSPLGDKIVVSEVYHGGAVDANGEIRRGDQILEINGHSLSDMTSAEVEEFLWEAEQKCPPGGYIRFLIAESEMRANQDEVTYF